MTQRINMMDGLRGFSLLGILIANMLIFQYGMFGKDNIEHLQLSTGDMVAYIWTKIFVESSFLPIFMFLFGFSLIKLKEKLERNNSKVKRHLIRRLLLFMVVGLFHSIFIWEGDILFTYGLIGFLMLIFLNRKRKTILIWAILLFMISSLFGFGEYEETEKEILAMESYIEKETKIYSTGSYAEVREFRSSEEDPFGYPDYFYFLLLLMTPFVVCPLFLMGMYAAKKNWFSHPHKERKKYRKTGIYFGIAGIVLKSTPYIFIDQGYWTEGAYTIGATFLAIGYIFGFCLLYTRGKGRLLTYLEQVGRLSMTNYLTQSVVCTVIFYHYGLGLFGTFGVLSGIVLSIVIFTIQIILSHLYLTFFKMGPLEKIMRIGTYLTWNGGPRRRKKEEVHVA